MLTNKNQKMKKLNLLFLVLIIAASFAGCKKGPDDPAISLLSRKARLTGDWSLKTANYSVTYDNGVYTYNYSSDNNIMTKKYEGRWNDWTDTYVYSKEILINKDGTFKITEIVTDNGTDTKTTEGYWFFAPKNKELDVKNKERVIFEVIKFTEIDKDGDKTFTNYTGTNNDNLFTIDLSELRNKEITFDLNYVKTDEDGLVKQVKGTEVYIQK